MKVKVHIVGGGSNAESFVDALINAGAEVDNHGVIFDKEEIRSLIGQCHFAINMMKSSVCVGLTIKSLDYFQMGLPMFNSIKGDTANIIEEYCCGYNVGNPIKCCERLRMLENKEYELMRKNAQKAFIENFTLKSFKKNLETGLRHLDL